MTTAPAVSAASGGDDLLNRRMITASVMMATTVVILDMTIATIALPHMQGGLGATQDQISWVMTTYFMMQAITMSATGWLAGRLGANGCLSAHWRALPSFRSCPATRPRSRKS